MSIIMFFLIFFALFIILMIIFNRRVFSFREKKFREDSDHLIAERVPWDRYYNKPKKQGCEVYEYMIDDKLFHRTFHNMDRIIPGVRYGGKYLNDKIKLYVDSRGRFLPLRTAYLNNVYAVCFSVVSAVISFLFIYFFVR